MKIDKISWNILSFLNPYPILLTWCGENREARISSFSSRWGNLNGSYYKTCPDWYIMLPIFIRKCGWNYIYEIQNHSQEHVKVLTFKAPPRASHVFLSFSVNVCLEFKNLTLREYFWLNHFFPPCDLAKVALILAVRHPSLTFRIPVLRGNMF